MRFVADVNVKLQLLEIIKPADGLAVDLHGVIENELAVFARI